MAALYKVRRVSVIYGLRDPHHSRRRACVRVDACMYHLPQTMDFTCVETQIGNGDKLDCDVVDLDGAKGYCRVKVPA